jgi:hypothetical protein
LRLMASSTIAQRSSKIHSNGVFATAPIKKGEVIMEYKGKMNTAIASEPAVGPFISIEFVIADDMDTIDFG